MFLKRLKETFLSSVELFDYFRKKNNKLRLRVDENERKNKKTDKERWKRNRRDVNRIGGGKRRKFGGRTSLEGY